MWDRGGADDRMRGYAVNLAWFSLVIVVILFSALWIIGLVMPAVAHGNVGIDLTVYLDRARDWMHGGSFYRDRQLTGAGYPVEHGDAFYPPVMLYLLVPFTVLPAILWWIIPGAIAVIALRRLRPNRWGWLLIAASLAYYRTWIQHSTGNPSIWIYALLLAGLAWRWPSALIVLKPTIAPAARIGARDPRWWITIAVIAILAIPFGALWFDFARAISGAQQSELYGWQYLLGEWPIVICLIVGGSPPIPRGVSDPVRDSARPLWGNG